MKASRCLRSASQMSAVVMIFGIVFVTAACMQSSQQRPEPSRSEIRAIVQEEIESPRMQEQITLAIQKEGVQPIVDQALRSSETETMVGEVMKRHLESPEFQKQLEQI